MSLPTAAFGIASSESRKRSISDLDRLGRRGGSGGLDGGGDKSMAMDVCRDGDEKTRRDLDLKNHGKKRKNYLTGKRRSRTKLEDNTK